MTVDRRGMHHSKLLVKGQGERRRKRVSGDAHKIQKQVLQEGTTSESQQDQEG